jgi:putative ABC transport system substrate-binding protein
LALRRREFLGVLSGAAVWPLTARAQQIERARRVGILLGAYTSTDQAGQVRIGAFLKKLRELGWEDGRNLRIDYRWGGGNTEQNNRLVTELVESAPDAIVATSDPVLAQLHKLTNEIPIIFTQTSEPVESGIVASLARPGGNKTGFQNFEPAIGGKWLEVLKEVAPGLTHAGAVFSPDAAAHAQFLRSPQNVAPSRHDGNCRRYSRRARACHHVVCRTTGSQPHGFPASRTIANRRLISSLAIRHHTPAVYPYRYFAADGGLITYGPDQIDQWRGTALYLDRILKGENPAGLPVQRRPSMSWQSTSRPPEHSASRCRRRWPAPTR